MPALAAVRREPPAGRLSLIRLGLYFHALLTHLFVASVILVVHGVAWG